ncbi:MAG: hypothetical protein ACREYE_17205 [Gammaproteobacteria bacterium]
MRSCYEAGRDGFWLHRYLVGRGIENVVLESASIEVDRRARRAKTDRLDGGKLLKQWVRHHRDEEFLRVVRVPSVEHEDERRLHRGVGAAEEGAHRAPQPCTELIGDPGGGVQAWAGFSSSDWAG